MNSQQGLALEIAGLVFAWPGEAACLDIAAFSMSAGEKLFLHGPSGSGKTTLLSIIGGVLHASAGRVKVSGVELAALGAHARDRFRADEIGFVFQLFNLIPYLSACDNILLPCRFSAARRRRIADAGTTPADEAQRLAAPRPAAGTARPAGDGLVGRTAAAGGCARADRPTGAGDRRRADFGAGCRPPGAFSRSAHGRVRRSRRGAALRESRPAPHGHFDRVVNLAEMNRAIAEIAA